MDVSQTEFPRRLDRIVKLLSDEQAKEKEIKGSLSFYFLLPLLQSHFFTSSLGHHWAECMEHFLKNNIMEGLYDISQLNFPSGLFRQITRTFAKLVTDLDRKFLVHASVHLPVLKLLKTAMFSAELNASTEKEVVELMFAITNRLVEYPDLLSVLFHEKKFNSFYAADDRRRSSSGGGEAAQSRAQEFQVSENCDFDYPLFLYLLHFVHYEGQIGDYARTALLFCLQTATPVVDEFILRYSGFSHIMVSSLAGRFASLSAQYMGSDAKEALNKFLSSLEYYQKAISESSPAVSTDLVNSFRKYFLMNVVLPKLAAEDITSAELTATMIYVNSMLEVITEENLSRDFVLLLVDDRFTADADDFQGSGTNAMSLAKAKKEAESSSSSSSNLIVLSPLESPALSFGSGLTQPLSTTLHPATASSTPPHSLKLVLLFRLNDPSEHVQEATWQLFHTLVSLHRAIAVPRLLQHTFELLNTMDVSDKTERAHTEEIRRYLEIFPTPQNVVEYEVFGYETYLLDVQDIVNSTQGTVAAKPANSKGKRKESGKRAALEERGGNGGQSPALIGERNDSTGSSSRNPSSRTPSTSLADPLSEQLEINDDPPQKSEPDMFLEILLARLETFTSNSFGSNLMITGVFTQLACFPDMRLSEFILHSDLLYNRYLLSLYAILSRVSQEMVKSLQSMPYSTEHLETMRNYLDATAIPKVTKNPSAAMDREKESLLKNVVVFEEFVKELTAALQIQLLTGRTQINYMD